MDAELDLTALRVMRAIADTGSITAAAARLGFSQPAISQQVHRAEDRLGYPLLVRTGRGVALTEAGRSVAAHAVHVQAALDAARQELAALSGAAVGTLRLAGFPSASSTIVPELVWRLGRSHPGLRVSYLEAEPPEAAALVADGMVDLALTFRYSGDDATLDGVTTGLVEHPLWTDHTVLVQPDARPSPESARGGLADVTALRDAAWIGGCPRCRGHLLTVCGRAGFVPRIVLETDNAAAVTGMVAKGLGVAILPGLSLRPVIIPDGVAVTPLGEEGDRIIAGMHVVGIDRVPAVRAALAALRSIEADPFGLRPHPGRSPHGPVGNVGGAR